MGRETDQYMNADEYVQELLINVRSLAGEYLNWKKQSVFAGEGRIRDTEVSREGILELSQILRRGKHSFEEMHRKAEQSVRRRTVIPLEYLFHIKKDIAGKEGYTVLSITQSGIKPKDLSKNEGQLADNYSHYQLLNPGDFAMNHMDLLTGWVDISKYSGVTSPDYRVFVLDDTEKNDSSYYLYLMQMCYFNRIFYGLGQGVSGMGRWRLQADKFLNFPVVVPPVDEQKEIASYLNEKCSCIEVMIAKKQQYLIEIENYKKSLIYEYVTGKKEVLPL